MTGALYIVHPYRILATPVERLVLDPEGTPTAHLSAYNDGLA